jgi:hypothetical protein
MKTKEQDYPTRAEYVAALGFWEIFVLARKYHYSQPVERRDSVGPVRRWLISLRAGPRPSAGRRLISCVVGSALGGVGGAAAFGAMANGYLALRWFLLVVGVAVFVLVAILAVFGVGAVLAFRAGGWEQMLRDRDRELAWEEQLRVLRGDSDGAAGRRFGGFWRRVRRSG